MSDELYPGEVIDGLGIHAAIMPLRVGVYEVLLDTRSLGTLDARNVPHLRGVELLIQKGKLTAEQVDFVKVGSNWRPTMHDLFKPEED